MNLCAPCFTKMNAETGEPNVGNIEVITEQVADALLVDGSSSTNTTWSSDKISSEIKANFYPPAFTSDIIPDTDDIRDIGTPSKRIKTIHVGDVVVSQNLELPGFSDVDQTLTSQGANISALIARTQHQSATVTTTTFGGTGGVAVTNGLSSASLNTGSAAVAGSASVGGTMTVAGFAVATSNDLAPINTNLTTLNTKTQNQTAVANATTFANTIEAKGTNTYSLDASTANMAIKRVGTGDIVNYNATTANVTTPVIRGLYIGPGTRPVCTGGYVATAAGTNVTNTTVETTIMPASGIGTLTIPANAMVAGSCSRLVLAGFLGIPAGLTLTIRFYAGPTSTQLLLTHAITPTAAIALNSAFFFEIQQVVRTAGVSGTSSTIAVMNIDGSGNFTRVQNGITIDTTVTNVFLLTAQWSAASGGTQIVSSQLLSTNLYQPTA